MKDGRALVTAFRVTANLRMLILLPGEKKFHQLCCCVHENLHSGFVSQFSHSFPCVCSFMDFHCPEVII